ncbi:hypothetical protein Sru01_49290 [Sphaerisporangium rufum]|uniref:Uncharacterized protein n=1 Tax=Sphaerisporangium rufum TaxID=1381558 RepID=A0A919V2Q6_9ACTN|nr:hypothetical protein [Sphaerisporangium rufum]GII79947.1 hypothetical protein Sru01_49290 [Sphaerisporangium rufum]
MMFVSPRHPVLRVLRALVFATVCVVISAGGHAFAGGGSVPPGVLGAGALVAMVLAYALSGHEPRMEVLLTTSIGTQALLHELFARTATSGAEHLAHGTHPDHGHLGIGMALVHLVIGTISGWWLHRGEVAIWLLLRLLAMGPVTVLRRLLGGATPVTTPVQQVSPIAGARAYRGRREIASAIHRRGPPVSFLAG